MNKNETQSSGTPAMDQKQAEMVGRLFNLAFNSSLLYGGSHHTTVEKINPLFQSLVKAFDQNKLLTLSVERDSMFVENCCVDKMVNPRRLIAYFKKADLQSVTFETGVTEIEIGTLIRIIGDLADSPSVEAIKSQLASNRVSRIRINYVLYRKVTADEAVIDKKQAARSSAQMQPVSAQSAPPPKEIKNDGLKEAVAGLAPLLSIRQLLDDPKTSIDRIMGSSGKETVRGVDELAARLKDLNAGVQDGTAAQNFPSPEEMMEAVIRLRKDVTRSLDSLRATGRVLEGSNAVAEELNSLSHETIIRLIRDEYRQGAVSTKRLAQIIKRLMPDVKELKIVLPHLKECLLADGMLPADYLQLVNSLIRDLDDDGLTQSLSTAAEDMGLSLEEIVQSIKSDPADAARLLILASEIRKGTKAEGEQLSMILSEYIERVSKKMALDSTGQADNPAIMKNFEEKLLDKLKTQGLEDSVVKQVRQKISPSKRGYDLPKGVFDIKVTTFFLEHEIKRYLRYNCPFSTIVFSLISVKAPDGSESIPTPEETGQILTSLMSSLRKMLRDLDLVGVMLWISENIPFIILPMTDQKGALAVKKRLTIAFNNSNVSCDGVAKKPHIVVTSCAFDGTKTPDSPSYIKEIMARHKEEIENVRGAAHA